MRVLDVADGYSNSAAPTSTVTSTITGSMTSPVSVTAVGGITPAGVGSEVMFVKGAGGVDISANPQIVAGTQDEQELELVGTSDTDTLLLEDGTGLTMNGPITLKLDYRIKFGWSNAKWREKWRREA